MVARPPGVLWTGVSLKQINTLAPGETVALPLTAAVTRAGVYEVNCLGVKASPVLIGGTDQQQQPFVPQLCDFSSLVTVVGADK